MNDIFFQLVGSGLVPALVGALFGFLSRGIDRNHGQELARLDRSFDITSSKYASYVDSVESLLRAIYNYQERGITDLQAEGVNVDEVPEDILQAEREVRVFAPSSIRDTIYDQFGLITKAMELDENAIADLQKSQDRLIELMRVELGLATKPKRRTLSRKSS